MQTEVSAKKGGTAGTVPKSGLEGSERRGQGLNEEVRARCRPDDHAVHDHAGEARLSLRRSSCTRSIHRRPRDRLAARWKSHLIIAGCSWLKRFRSPAAAAVHAAAAVAAGILMLPHPISTAAALTFNVLWDHLLELCQRDGSQQLRAGCEQRHSIAPAAAHRASYCGGPVGGSFASGFFLLQSIVESSRTGATESIRTKRHCPRTQLPVPER